MTEQKIAELVQKYADGTASKDEIAELMSWYRQSDIKEVLWQTSNPNEQQDVYKRMLGRLHESIQERPKMARLQWLKVAAIFILIIGVSFFAFRYLKTSTPSYTTVINPSGKIQLVQLPDESKVWLNASSTLRYAKGFKEKRELQLDGEAYFEVAHDAAHPFIVSGGEVNTTVLGTVFNIKAYKNDKETIVSLISGSVRVATDKELGVLTPSTKMEFDRQSKKVQTVKIDASRIGAWKEGKLFFDGQKLSEIANTLGRWYGIKFVFQTPGLGNCRYYMNFDSSTPLEQLLSTVAEIADMRYSINKQANTVIFSGKGCF